MKLHSIDINEALLLGQKVTAGHTPQVTGEDLDLGFAEVVDADRRYGGWLTALDVWFGL